VENNREAKIRALQQETKRRLANIANLLQGIADKTGITSLDEFFKKPPSERYIPGPEVGKFIRGKLYDQMHNWSTVRDNVTKEEKRGLIDQVREAQQNKDFLSWKQLQHDGLVKKDADIKTYDPEKVDYHVDHTQPVSLRWNNKGRDGNDNDRLIELTERANLRLVTAEYNLSKASKFEGSGTHKYKDHVGSNFTSTIAEGGIQGALTINIEDKPVPFNDAAGNPLVKNR
jgi:hypothetical protein